MPLINQIMVDTKEPLFLVQNSLLSCELVVKPPRVTASERPLVLPFPYTLHVTVDVFYAFWSAVAINCFAATLWQWAAGFMVAWVIVGVGEWVINTWANLGVQRPVQLLFFAGTVISVERQWHNVIAENRGEAHYGGRPVQFVRIPCFHATEETRKLWQKFHIHSFPAFVLVQDNEAVATYHGNGEMDVERLVKDFGIRYVV